MVTGSYILGTGGMSCMDYCYPAIKEERVNEYLSVVTVDSVNIPDFCTVLFDPKGHEVRMKVRQLRKSIGG